MKPGGGERRELGGEIRHNVILRYYVGRDRGQARCRIRSSDEGILMIKRLSPAFAIALLIVPIAPAAAQQLPPPPSAFEAPDRMPPDVSQRIAPPPSLANGQTSYGEASPYGAIPTYGRVGANGEPSDYGQPNAFPNGLPSGQPYGQSNGQLSNGQLSGQPYGQSNGQLSGQPYGQTSYRKASPYGAIPTYGRIGADGLPQ
jgi:hypothetical protein